MGGEKYSELKEYGAPFVHMLVDFKPRNTITKQAGGTYVCFDVPSGQFASDGYLLHPTLNI